MLGFKSYLSALLRMPSEKGAHMSFYDLRKHLNQRVKIRVQSSPRAIMGVVKVVDGSSLKLRTFVTVPGRLQLRSEEIDIPCDRIISILPEKWQ
jgi:hypothetical protein